MVPGRWLHRLASRWCSTSTREQIVEPLLSDFQHQWIADDRRTSRAITLVRGYLAFWQTLALCSLRATAHLAVKAPSRLTFERLFVGTYAVAIVLVIVFGFAWVRTGTLDPTAGMIAIRRLSATFGPGLFLGRYWPRARSMRTRLLVLVAFSCAVGLGCWINTDGRIAIPLYSLLYLGLVWRQRIWKRT